MSKKYGDIKADALDRLERWLDSCRDGCVTYIDKLMVYKDSQEIEDERVPLWEVELTIQGYPDRRYEAEAPTLAEAINTAIDAAEADK